MHLLRRLVGQRLMRAAFVVEADVGSDACSASASVAYSLRYTSSYFTLRQSRSVKMLSW